MMLTPSDRATLAYLHSPIAIRDRCNQLFHRACNDQLRFFRCDLGRIEAVADYVLQVTREAYPNLEIPFHSRWRHFEVGTGAKLADFTQQLAMLSPQEQVWAKWDLAIVSVLLDAGAGATWRYREPETGLEFSRSEGLAVASLHLFCAGLFSSDPVHPLQADAIGLQSLTVDRLGQGLQVSPENPIIGLPGRVKLLQRLGQVLQQQPQVFGAKNPRPGYLLNAVLPYADAGRLDASLVLQAVLDGLSQIWPSRMRFAGVNLGDVWAHPALPSDSPTTNLVPFHKLSQWLTYSLLEPLQDFGLTISHLDALTGLAEYRNGGLCLDLGVLQPKGAIDPQVAYAPDTEVIVEWRALTIVLLDRIAMVIRQRLNRTAEQLPLVQVLQGGTWSAGRRIAMERRSDGTPPLQIESDGTVF
jgi:hypothetical protein